MDFSVIFQLRNKKFWWMDVIFYFVISLLIATVFCYLIFLTKDYLIGEKIKDETKALETVGTDTQKQHEAEVIKYRDKISNFSQLFENHTFASNVFPFLQKRTMPNVWFKQFNLDEKNGTVQLSGESENIDAFSRQVATYESEDNKKYIKSIGTLNTLLGDSARAEFNINLALNQDIFSYLSSLPSISATVSSTEQQAQANNTGENGQQNPSNQSIEKLITVFHILLKPEVVGQVDETNYTVVLNVPYGTNVKNLVPDVVISTGATLSPASGIAQDFTNPAVYTVTAQDGSVQSYKVTVNILPQVVKKSSNMWTIVLSIIAIIVFVIVIIAAVLLFLRRRKKLNT